MPSDEAVYEAVVDAVELVCGLSRDELDPHLTIDNLGIDSLSASEIVQEVESALGVTVDLKSIASGWSSFTLTGLTKMFVDAREASHGS